MSNEKQDIIMDILKQNIDKNDSIIYNPWFWVSIILIIILIAVIIIIVVKILFSKSKKNKLQSIDNNFGYL